MEKIFKVVKNGPVADGVYEIVLRGDCALIKKPGQFVNVKIDGFYLRRPLSVCDASGDLLTLIYKVAGRGTEALAGIRAGAELSLLTGLGNGYDTSKCGSRPALIGGGVGVPPMYLLAKRLISEEKKPLVVLGFNKKSEVFYEERFKELGAEVRVAVLDGSYGIKGLVTDAVSDADGADYFFACGPEKMLKAVSDRLSCDGQLSFEKRMGCGFGACMGCSCKTKYGQKRICKEGPVLEKGEIIW